MIIKYEITSKSQYENYKSFYFLILFSIIGVPLMILKLGAQSIFFDICCMAGAVISGSIPLYSLHKNYYRANKGDELICDFDNKSM